MTCTCASDVRAKSVEGERERRWVMYRAEEAEGKASVVSAEGEANDGEVCRGAWGRAYASITD
jgi:hypothetical protein